MGRHQGHFSEIGVYDCPTYLQKIKLLPCWAAMTEKEEMSLTWCVGGVSLKQTSVRAHRRTCAGLSEHFCLSRSPNRNSPNAHQHKRTGKPWGIATTRRSTKEDKRPQQHRRTQRQNGEEKKADTGVGAAGVHERESNHRQNYGTAPGPEE